MLHVACPDCGHPFQYRVDIQFDPDRLAPPRVVVNEQDFTERFTRHVMLNPDRHPSFATPVPD
jgi:hypothetical protein